LQNNRRTKGAIYTHSTVVRAEGICHHIGVTVYFVGVAEYNMLDQLNKSSRDLSLTNPYQWRRR